MSVTSVRAGDLFTGNDGVVAREKEIVSLTDALDAVEHLVRKKGKSCDK